MNTNQRTVQLQASHILEDLANGLAWYQKDDIGNGSIQEKYGAKDFQILSIQKHLRFKDAEGNLLQPETTVFTVVDDVLDTEIPPAAQSEAPEKVTQTETQDEQEGREAFVAL